MQFTCIHFERYADDTVVHCRSENQLKFIESKIRTRFTRCGLELRQEKTSLFTVRIQTEPDSILQSFDFLGYTFRPRNAQDRDGKFFVSFSPAVSLKALKAMRLKIKGHPLIKGGFSQSVIELAKTINPIIQGWINYYGKFRKSSMSTLYDYINTKLIKWARRKFKPLQRRKWRASRWLRELYREFPTLFAHWRVWSWVAA